MTGADRAVAIASVLCATGARNYPDCPVMPTLVGSVGVLAAGWGCRWWAGRDKPKLVEASNPRRRWPWDPDALEEPRRVRCAIEPQTETCLPRLAGHAPVSQQVSSRDQSGCAVAVAAKGGRGNDAGLLVAEAQAAFDQTRCLGRDPTG